MGCGKSSLGKKLAKKKNFNFIDLDNVIETKEGLSVDEIFNIKGEAYFRLLESDLLSSIETENSIIALGGGTPCHSNNMQLINELGVSIYLQMNSGLLTDRLFNSKQTRPLIEAVKSDKQKLNELVVSLLNQREVFYSKATISFEASNMTSTKLGYLIEMIDYIK